MIRQKVLVIGLDGTPASCLFSEMAAHFPNIDRLARGGYFGILRSSDPPITVPAWACMMSGKDPGELGLYGFHYRRPGSYGKRQLVHAGLLPPDMLWHWLGSHGGRAVVLGVPPSYPPPLIHGTSVSCLLTPRGASVVCQPPAVQTLMRNIAPDYRFDIESFRSLSDGALFDQAVAALRARFRLARELARRETWNLFVITDIGTDRVQHGLWKAEGSGGWGEMVRRYYAIIDEEVGEWLAELPDHICVWLVSDHGAQPSHGGVFLNEWLRRRGWLKLRQNLPGATAWNPEAVDWEKTRAWAEGGYAGRVYINVRGREPRGCVDQGDVERICEELREALAKDFFLEDGRDARIRCYRPRELYRDCQALAPDLLVYVDDLRMRVFASLGGEDLYAPGNDFGRDYANHHHDGIFIAYDPRQSGSGWSGVLPITALRQCLEQQLRGGSVVFSTS